jgi:hypothetical protein
MTPLEEIEDIFGIYASYPYNGNATCCFGVRTRSRNELERNSQTRLYTQWGMNSTGDLPIHVFGKGNNWNNFLPRGMDSVGNFRKDMRFLLMADNLFERMTRPTFNLGDKRDQDNLINIHREMQSCMNWCKYACYVWMYAWMSCVHNAWWQNWQDEWN